MMPNINSRQMQQMMKKMGIQQDDIDAEEVIIKCKDKNIIISNPSVQKVNMMGKWSYQVSGDESEEDLDDGSEDDIQTIVDQAQCSEDEAKQALKDTNGNIAEAILLLTAEKEE
ncbi:MAG: nascent polypeptide-associated complex protein [Candidatus Woesearchaeota archaeon]